MRDDAYCKIYHVFLIVFLLLVSLPVSSPLKDLRKYSELEDDLIESNMLSRGFRASTFFFLLLGFLDFAFPLWSCTMMAFGVSIAILDRAHTMTDFVRKKYPTPRFVQCNSPMISWQEWVEMFLRKQNVTFLSGRQFYNLRSRIYRS